MTEEGAGLGCNDKKKGVKTQDGLESAKEKNKIGGEGVWGWGGGVGGGSKKGQTHPSIVNSYRRGRPIPSTQGPMKRKWGEKQTQKKGGVEKWPVDGNSKPCGD